MMAADGTDALLFLVHVVAAAIVVSFIYCCMKCLHRNPNLEPRNRRPEIAQPPPAPPPAVAPSPQPPATAAKTLFKHGDGGANGGVNSECSICLDEFMDGEVCRIIPRCKHVFHRHCIDQWLIKERHCPLCRSSVIVRFVYPST